ncbi:hypothetical protein SHKM778_16550 [Streptomyces sp. KM77-8]|uniref:Uncharacterized protein n=1 Tax=Streptomyces haneummycinicus TaxID=3074435 RepID=A0AAT9HDI5_9ACTN
MVFFAGLFFAGDFFAVAFFSGWDVFDVDLRAGEAVFFVVDVDFLPPVAFGDVLRWGRV